MTQVNKKICLEILKRSLQVDCRPADFHGLAKDWFKYHENDFQEFTREHHIFPATIISIWDRGSNKYSVQIS